MQDTLLYLLLQLLAAGGGGALVAYGLFQWFGSRWLESLFAKRLQSLQHAHEHAIEKVRETVQTTFSRVSKVHEREFEVLPKLWFYIRSAHGIASIAVIGRMQSLPDFDSMNEQHLEAFLARTEFSDVQKEEMRKASDVAQTYIKICKWRDVAAAKEEHRILNNYILENQIFLPVELFDLVRDFSSTMILGITNSELGKAHANWDMEQRGMTSIESLDGKLIPIGAAIQKRLGHDLA